VVLNVGHGLCVVLADSQGTMLFDVAPGPVPRDYLRSVGITDIDAVMLSHFHKDHCAGFTGFLGGDYMLQELFMNRPRSGETEVYEDIKATLNASRERRHGLPRVRPFDTDADRPVLSRGRVQVEIIAPDAVDARSHTTRSGLRQTDHSSCGVVRIDYDERPRVLITGDLSRRGLADIVSRDPDVLRADVLVYPHHGGSREERNEEAFAQELYAHVAPHLVVFSIGRTNGERPHPEVLSGVSSTADPRVVCTQLSPLCDDREPGHAGRLDPLPMVHSAAPEKRQLSCGGSVVIPLAAEGGMFIDAAGHEAFLDRADGVPDPMCRRR
jgi:beta-lactamase superfamily II metal-dependent hydrolase